MKNILGYYLMPHPPIILPEVGRGEEKKISKSTDSCDKIGKEIAGLKPETIVVITPHGTMFSDAIAISDEERMSGDLRQFGAGSAAMDIALDRELNMRINHACQQENIPAALINASILKRFKSSFKLDHGAMIPLWFINKYYTDYKLVHITYSTVGNMNLYKFGMEIEKAAKALDRKIVIIASGDLSHRLKEEGPYSYSPYGERFDKEFIGHLEQGDLLSLFNMDHTMVEEAGQCGLNSVFILLGALEGNEFKGELLSYEGPFGVGYGVMRFESKEKEISGYQILESLRQERAKKKMSDTNPYTKLARESLNYYFEHGKKMMDFTFVDSELLTQKHGVFVSLKKFGALRGCIGTISATTDCVAEEIVRNAIEAALHDPRFQPVDDYELEDIDISVDVLMDAVPATKSELNIEKYGVIVSKGNRRGLLLPDLEGVDSVEEQLKIACDKAGIGHNEDYEIEKFEVIRYKEGE